MKYTATNIRLPAQTLEALKIRAAKQRKSLAQLVREAIELTYHIGAAEPAVDPRKDPLHRLVGAWASGLKDGSVSHDRDIYGPQG
ncbi:MAG: ribbon-helix-helix protein, CopG family [Elusimicrobia bacterium]|nr:ribbon-helix-helix protein, CopG family [Elusimicrobiota bacterium]